MSTTAVAAGDETARPPAKKWLKAGVRLVFSVVILTFVLSTVDLGEFRDGWRRIDTATWVVTLCAFLALHVLNATKWRFVIGLAGAPIPWVHALRCHAVGLFANLCLPSLIGGDVLRMSLAMTATKRRAAVAVGSVADRILDLSALLAVAVAGMLIAPDALESGAGQEALPVAAAVIATGVVGGLVTLWWAASRVRRLPRKLGRPLVGILRGWRTIRRRPLHALFAWTLCVTAQAGFIVAAIGLGSAAGLELDTGVWFALWPLAKIAAMVPVSLGGLGVREGAFGVLVDPFGSKSLAITVSLAWQAVLIVGGLVAGAFWAASSSASPAPDGSDA